MPTKRLSPNGAVKEATPKAEVPSRPPVVAEQSQPAPKQSSKFEIKMPNIQTMTVRIVGDAPLISNCFPEKLKRQMREERERGKDSSSGGRKRGGPKPKRDFGQEFEDSLYPIPGGGYGFPAVAFKHAIVGACRQVPNGLTMEQAKRVIHVLYDAFSRDTQVVRIEGKPEKKEAVVRLAGQEKLPDIRYRGHFFPWSAWLSIRFNADVINAEGVLAYLQLAGFGDGVGENRPSSGTTGDHGTFHVAQEGE